MKTILIVSIVILFSVGTVSAGEITITNPNNQSKWLIGSTQKIKWTATGITKKMTITLWMGNIKMGVIADNVVPPPPGSRTATMSHSWKVGDLLGGKALPGNNYQIGIEAQGSRHCYKSAPYFEIREMVIKQFPKTKFWDLSLEKVAITRELEKTKVWNENIPENDIIYIFGQRTSTKDYIAIWITPTINIKTPPKSKITKADVSKWGTPRSFQVKLQIENQNPGLYGGSEEFSTATPQFTWEDVQTWPEEGKTFTKKLTPSCAWYPSLYFIRNHLGEWFPTTVDIDNSVSLKGAISETDEYNNGAYYGHPYLVFYDPGKSPRIRLLYNPETIQPIGNTMKIKWKATHIHNRMKILLWQDNDLIGEIARNILPPPPVQKNAEMSYSWEVGRFVNRKVVAKPGKLYWIMIKTYGHDANTEKYYQTTEVHYFTITQYIELKIKPKATSD